MQVMDMAAWWYLGAVPFGYGYGAHGAPMPYEPIMWLWSYGGQPGQRGRAKIQQRVHTYLPPPATAAAIAATAAAAAAAAAAALFFFVVGHLHHLNLLLLLTHQVQGLHSRPGPPGPPGGRLV